MQVLGGMRRHGVLELLLVLPDGSKSLIPSGWTDADRSGVDGETAATLGALTDLLRACELVTELTGRRGTERGQAAGKSPCEEDFHAVCPAQSDARPGPGATGPGVIGPGATGRGAIGAGRGFAGGGVALATALLAGVIAKAAAPSGREATVVPRVHLPVSLAGPTPSGMPVRPVVVGAALHPVQSSHPTRLPPAPTAPLRRNGGAGITPAHGSQRLVAHVLTPPLDSSYSTLPGRETPRRGGAHQLRLPGLHLPGSAGPGQARVLRELLRGHEHHGPQSQRPPDQGLAPQPSQRFGPIRHRPGDQPPAPRLEAGSTTTESSTAPRCTPWQGASTSILCDGPCRSSNDYEAGRPGHGGARHRSTAPTHLVRPLVPAAIHPTPDCGSRMTGDLTFGAGYLALGHAHSR